MRSALACALMAALGGCGGQLVASPSSSGRDDVTVASYQTHVHDGLSGEVAIDLPDDAGAALIELAGARGQFKLAELVTPAGDDVVESGGFMTRDAREADGLVDWLYPNSPALALTPGRQRLRFTALDGAGVVGDEDVTVRLYTRAPATGGALSIDFFFAADALDDATQASPLGDALAARVAALYAQVGLEVADYTVGTLGIGGSDLVLADGRPTAASLATLERALAAAGARPHAVHLVIARALDDGNGPVAGYALGLPGPFAPDRPTAAVLVSAQPFVSPSTGELDSAAMGVTCAHEIGHYLGLYHTSERDGTAHDPIADTPECDGSGICDDATNIMFWTGGGARSKLTPGQGAVMRSHPLVLAAAAPPSPPPPADCGGICRAPDTCVVLDGHAACARACDGDDPCPTGTCAPADDGTYVCRTP